jgi:glycosyltransferase involved in cell wall biosynthesis
MAAEQTVSPAGGSAAETGRPVLIVDAETLGQQRPFLQHLLVGLAAESSCPALVCPPGFDADLMPVGPVEVVTHPVFRTILLWRENFRKLLAALEKFKPTVLHCLSGRQANLTRQIAEHLDLPYVATVNSLAARAVRYRLLVKSCAAVIAPTRAIARHIAERYPALSGRVTQINMGTFVEETCACFSRPGRMPSVLVLHRLTAAEDFEPLLGAFRHLLIDGYELTAAIIGAGRAESRLRRLLKDLGLAGAVSIVGPVQPLRAVFIGADILVRPRPVLSFDASLIEAMSVGLAVAGCQGGVDDLLVDNQTAVVFEPQDEFTIYSALQKLLGRREFARRIATAGQLQIRAEYSVSKMVSAHLQVYQHAQQSYKSTSGLS